MIKTFSRSFAKYNVRPLKKVHVDQLGTKEAHNIIIDSLLTQKMVVFTGVKNVVPIRNRMHYTMAQFDVIECPPMDNTQGRVGDYNNGMNKRHTYW